MIGRKDGNFFQKSLIVCIRAITVVNKHVYYINVLLNEHTLLCVWTLLALTKIRVFCIKIDQIVEKFRSFTHPNRV